MAGLVIGKLCFGKNALAFGLEICLAKAGLHAYPVTVQTAASCDVLLVSMFWYQDIYAFELFRRRAGIHKGTGKPYIIIGGMQATMTPEIVAELGDYVFVGDGDDHFGGIIKQLETNGRIEHPHVYHSGMDTVPPPAECAPSAFGIWTQGDDGKGTFRVEIARGCKYKCPFCCLSNLKPFREVPYSELEPLIRKAAGKRCAFFAPDRTCHSEWHKIRQSLKAHGCHDWGQDARLENISEVEGASVTFGLEGISPRLGKTVGKPFEHDYILSRMGEFVESRKNIANVSAYFIADLPDENEEDWTTLKELFERINSAEWSRRLVFCPVLNPLSPKSFTRMESTEIHIFRDYETRWRNLLRRDGGQWGFRVVETLVWGPYERLRDALVQRGGAAGYRLIRAMPDKLLVTRPPLGKRTAIARELCGKLPIVGLSLERLEGRCGNADS